MRLTAGTCDFYVTDRTSPTLPLQPIVMLAASSAAMHNLNPINIVHVAVGAGGDESDPFLRPWI
jgi:hypothetical protein